MNRSTEFCTLFMTSNCGLWREKMKKCEITAVPPNKLREVLVTPANQNVFLQAKQSTESVLAQLRESRKVEPGQLKEPYNL
jgi:hypothetical protein